MTAAPFLLPWTYTESARATKTWKANCGPHSIAAALSIRLETVREAIVNFRGYMNPTQVRDTLHALRVPVAIAGRVRTTQLCQGINYVQWEGWWTERGQPWSGWYKHSHWIAHWDGWVLCTACNPNAWLTIPDWHRQLEARGDPWHIRAHYRLHTPPRPAGTVLPDPAPDPQLALNIVPFPSTPELTLS